MKYRQALNSLKQGLKPRQQPMSFRISANAAYFYEQE